MDYSIIESIIPLPKHGATIFDELFPLVGQGQSAGPIWRARLFCYRRVYRVCKQHRTWMAVNGVPKVRYASHACPSSSTDAIPAPRPPIILRGLGWKDAACTVYTCLKNMRRSLAFSLHLCLTIVIIPLSHRQ
jgi:hypothetical protein